MGREKGSNESKLVLHSSKRDCYFDSEDLRSAWSIPFINTKKLQEAVPAVEERGPAEPIGHLLETRECPWCDITPHILRTLVHDT